MHTIFINVSIATSKQHVISLLGTFLLFLLVPVDKQYDNYYYP